MFIHYYRYHEKYRCRQLHSDSRLEIVYPANDHGMITKQHDFYVIGQFHDVEIHNDARLLVELFEQSSGRKVRSVAADLKNNYAGMYADFPELDTQEDVETVRHSGMPDLVYDPSDPDSFWNTWNKAFFTDNVFSALIWGGACTLNGRLNPYDQYGEKMTTLEDGIYELRVTLFNGEENISSGKTIWLTDGRKEIILSRFSPEIHVKNVEAFAASEGFESFTDPYAGIWDTQFFSFKWPIKAWVELPGRWHYGDAQEYRKGDVHIFNYNISEAAVSWKTEIGSLLHWNPDCFSKEKRIHTYYYEKGHPSGDIYRDVLLEMKHEQCFAVTKLEMESEESQNHLCIEAVCKPISSGTFGISETAFQVENRVSYFVYRLYEEKSMEVFYQSEPFPVGITVSKENAPSEFLPLHVKHTLSLPKEMNSKFCQLEITATDCNGKECGRQSFKISTGGISNQK